MSGIKFTHPCETCVRSIPQNTFNDKPILAQVMLGTDRQKAITWANVDLTVNHCLNYVDQDPCRHMTSLYHNEFNDNERKFAIQSKNSKVKFSFNLINLQKQRCGQIWVLLFVAATAKQSNSWIHSQSNRQRTYFMY